MAIIKKKIWPEYFKLVKAGKKRFEVRLADFDIKEGDTLILEEWDPKTKKYTGRTIEKKVDYILKFNLDDSGQKKEIEERGLYVIQFQKYIKQKVEPSFVIVSEGQEINPSVNSGQVEKINKVKTPIVE